MKYFSKLFLMVAMFVASISFALAQDKAVYHIDNAESQATKGLRNVRNHLDVAPDTKIIVVTHANGVDFLMEGAKDCNGLNYQRSNTFQHRHQGLM